MYSQSNVVSPKYIYYERVYVFTATTKVDPTVYKKYEIKVFNNHIEAIEGGLGIGDYYALPPVGGKSFIVKITELPLLPTTNGSIENRTIYLGNPIK